MPRDVSKSPSSHNQELPKLCFLGRKSVFVTFWASLARTKLFICWELGHKEGWAPKNWCFQIVVLEKILDSPLDSKEIKKVNPKGNQSWIFIRRTAAEAEAPILWPADAKSRLIGKDPNAGRDWGQEEKGLTEDEVVGWHHWLNRHGFEETQGVSDRQRNPACYTVHKELDVT